MYKNNRATFIKQAIEEARDKALEASNGGLYMKLTAALSELDELLLMHEEEKEALNVFAARGSIAEWDMMGLPADELAEDT
jgi:hypothetical protein